MNLRHEIPTLLLVTLVTALIWLYAERRDISAYPPNGMMPVQVEFVAPKVRDMVIALPQRPIQVQFRGATAHIERLRDRLDNDNPIELRLDLHGPPLEPGNREVDVKRLLTHALSEYGVSIINVEPASPSVNVLQMVTRTATVRFAHTEVQLLGPAQIEPQQIQIEAPALALDRLAAEDNLILDAVLPNPISDYTAGVQITERATIKLPADLPLSLMPYVSIDPREVAVTFTIEKKESRTELTSVPVWLDAPPGETDRFVVTLDPESALLRNVIVVGPTDQIEQIGQTIIVKANLVLTADDFERYVDQGPQTAEVQFYLPGDLRVETRSRTVTFQVTYREQ
ncbi:MAG: hypothetical protein CMJ49_01670 [Planctomycetaceae bacterium]|nr:hypothetical protein [Planctomycetaceae bacterium]